MFQALIVVTIAMFLVNQAVTAIYRGVKTKKIVDAE